MFIPIYFILNYLYKILFHQQLFEDNTIKWHEILVTDHLGGSYKITINVTEVSIPELVFITSQLVNEPWHLHTVDLSHTYRTPNSFRTYNVTMFQISPLNNIKIIIALIF